MGDRNVSRLPHYAALVVVAGLHIALVTVLIAASRTRLRSSAAQTVITTMVLLPRAGDSLAAGPPPELHLAPLAPPVRLAPLVPPLPSIAYPPADNVPQAIDWQAQAQKAAAAITGSNAVPSETEDRRKTSSSHGP